MSNSQSKVGSRVPIWLWLILVPLTLAVISGIIVSLIPPDLDKVYAEAEALLSTPDSKEKFESKMRLLESDSAYADHANMLRGRVALSQNREPMALKLFGKVTEGSPLEAEAAQRAGDAHSRIGNFGEAVKSYRRALEKDSEGGLASRMSLASLYFIAGGIQLALNELDQNIELDQQHEASRVLRAQIRVFLDEPKLALEDFEAVLDSPGKFSSTPPDFVEAYLKCLVDLNELEKLEEVADAHLATVANGTTKSTVLTRLGEFRAAMVTLQSREGQASPPAVLNEAKLDLLLAEGNIESAELLAKEVVKSSPRRLSAMKLVAKTFEAAGNTRMQKIAEENVAGLLDLKTQLRSAIDDVSDNITDVPGRLKVARLFGEVAEYAQMNSWYRVIVMLDPSAKEEYQKVLLGETLPRGPVVPFDEPKEEEPAESGDGDNDNDKMDEAAKQSEADSDGSEMKASEKNGSQKQSTEKKTEQPDSKDKTGEDKDAAKAEEMKEATEAKPEPEAAKTKVEETAGKDASKESEPAKKADAPEASDKKDQQ